ncbi:hypothetical protein PQG02_00290 (plasmid) [Nostoc sp. UHCC 0926]|uniref:hypothetical protein n=1 Tax=Nostoc sp. UHCC 0926 TaxID=3025190 RepID=UPI0023613ADD|nr:hypothetical protein [Nostoc sp. UHCC 0926]WDD30126.1 hypothetical protein PQG02_00290 [Nostoc sp. UHCC 0926]
MASDLPTASGDINLGKIESPVVEEDTSTTGQQNVDESILEELQAQLQNNRSQIEELSSEIKTLKSDNQKLHKQLQTAKTELQKKVTNSSSEEILRTEISQLKEDVAFFRELSDGLTGQKVEWYESLQENPLLKAQVIQLTEEVSQLQSHSQQLQQENSELQKQVGNSIQPDIDSIRDRILAKLKVGRQSTAGKAIDAFIKELRHVKTASTAASVADKASITSKTDDKTVTTTLEQKPPTWEARADDFLKEVAGNG